MVGRFCALQATVLSPYIALINIFPAIRQPLVAIGMTRGFASVDTACRGNPKS